MLRQSRYNRAMLLRCEWLSIYEGTAIFPKIASPMHRCSATVQNHSPNDGYAVSELENPNTRVSMGWRMIGELEITIDKLEHYKRG